jgi:hypothetical protein
MSEAQNSGGADESHKRPPKMFTSVLRPDPPDSASPETVAFLKRYANEAAGILGCKELERDERPDQITMLLQRPK